MKLTMAIIYGVTLCMFFQPSLVRSEAGKPHVFFLPTLKGHLVGLVDGEGAVLIPPQYKSIEGFNDTSPNIARVETPDGKFGYISTSGEFIHKPTLDEARSFVKDGFARFQKNGKWGFVGVSGKYLVEPNFDKVDYFSNGLAAVGKGENWSYIDTGGKVAIAGPFSHAGPFSATGLAAVKKQENEKYGFIDTKGEWVIKPKYDEVRSFSIGNRAAVAIDDKWGVIDSAGDWVVKPKFHDIGWFDEHGVATFIDDYPNGGIINQNGKILLDNIDSYQMYYDSACRVVSETEHHVTFFDLDGKPIKALNTPKYLLASEFDSNCLSLVLISRTDNWGRVNREGRLHPLPDEVLEPYFNTWTSDATALAQAGGKFVPVVTHDRNLAYVDETGKIAMTARKIVAGNADILIVQNPAGKELWRHSYPKDTLIETGGHPAFLNPGNKEFGFEPPSEESMKKLVETLQAEPPGMFSINYGFVDREGEDWFGTGRVLVHIYYNEFDYGSNYTHVINTYQFDTEFLSVKKELEKTLGAPLNEDEIDEGPLGELNISVEEDESAVWKLGNRFLYLEKYFRFGDGDIRSGVNIMLLPTPEAQREANDLPIVPGDVLKIAEPSDADVKTAVEALIAESKDAGSVKLLRLAADVLDLARAGRQISANDYIRTQYALILAWDAGQESVQVGSVEQLVAVAANVMSFIENNGLGEQLLTEAGQFRLTVYRKAGNVAWHIRESDPKTALKLIEKAIPYAREEDCFLKDTYVRVLLNLGEEEKAYGIVRDVLDENSWFVDFGDFYEDEDYIAWLKRNGGTVVSAEDIPKTTKNVGEKQDIAVHPETNRIAIYWNDEIHLFDGVSGERLHRMDAGTYDPFSFRFNADGKKLVSSGWKRVSVWDAVKGKMILREPIVENSECAGFSMGDKHFFYDDEVVMVTSLSVCALPGGEKRFKLRNTGDCNVSADNRRLAISVDTDTDEDRIAIVDLEKPGIIANLTGKKADASDDDMYFVDGTRKLLVGESSNFHLWNIADQKVEYTWDTGDMDVTAIVVADSFMMAVDDDVRQFAKRIWKFGSPPGPETKIAFPQRAQGYFMSMSLSADQSKYVITKTNSLENLFFAFVYDLKTDTLLHEYVTPSMFYQAKFMNGDKYLVLDSYPVQIVDLETGKVAHRLRKLK